MHMTLSIALYSRNRSKRRKESILSPVHSKNEIIYNNNYTETIKLGESIEIVYPQITHLYNLIDFTNWWFYESDNCSRGGIDEYMFDKESFK